MTDLTIFNPLDDLAASGSLPPEAEPPVRIAVPHGSPWPVHVLVPWARDFIKEFAHERQVPEAMVAQTVLALFASALSGKFDVAPKGHGGWREDVNLYLCTIADSGERKSAIVNSLEGIITDFERESGAQAGEEQRDRTLRAELFTAERSRIKAEYARADDEEDREKILERLREVDRTIADIRPVADAKVLLDDVTPESLIDAMSKRRGRVTILSAEAGLLEDLADGRYGNGNANIDPFLKGLTGDSIRVERKTSGPRFVAHPRVTISIMAQPQVMEKIGNNDRLLRRGLIGRFLYAWPPSLVGKRISRPTPIQQHVREAFERNAAHLFRLPDTLTDSDELDPVTLRFDAAGQQLFDAFDEEIEREIGDDGDLRPHRRWCNRLLASVARLAAILAVTDVSEPPPGARIPLGAVQRAIELGRYYLGDMQVTTNGMARPENADTAEILIEQIRKAGWKRFTRRELQRRLGKKSPPAKALTALLETLVDSAHLIEVDFEGGSGKRRVSGYQVNTSIVPGGAPDARAERIGPYLSGEADST